MMFVSGWDTSIELADHPSAHHSIQQSWISFARWLCIFPLDNEEEPDVGAGGRVTWFFIAWLNKTIRI